MTWNHTQAASIKAKKKSFVCCLYSIVAKKEEKKEAEVKILSIYIEKENKKKRIKTIKIKEIDEEKGSEKEAEEEERDLFSGWDINKKIFVENKKKCDFSYLKFNSVVWCYWDWLRLYLWWLFRRNWFFFWRRLENFPRIFLCTKIDKWSTWQIRRDS